MKPHIGKHDSGIAKVEVKKSSVMLNGKSVPFNLTDKGLVLEEPPASFTTINIEGNKVIGCSSDKNGNSSGLCFDAKKE